MLPFRILSIYTFQVIRYWLTYVHTAGIDWYLNEEDGIKRLAQAFGPGKTRLSPKEPQFAFKI